jgi:TolB-like protein/Tfp pilus assembly protein PilF/predicted Ser/Thr protein kinase
MIGQTIAHYKILEKLGAGGMGEVYLAFDAKLDRKVALKFLPSSLSQDPNARQRLLREAKSASKLNHANITMIHAVESVEGRDFIVMEYVEGRNLSEHLESQSLSLSERLALVIQIGEGLAKAHAGGVFHRDIKPSNILVDLDGRAKLLDFGLATFSGATRLTQTGTTVGTAAYMSPEQAQSREVDHRSDLFSLGVVLFEVITGRLPFEGAHTAALMYSIVNDPPAPLTRFVATAPEELQRIVSKSLTKHPGERYQSASDFIADLRRYLRTSTSGSEMAQAQGPRRKMVAVLPFENLGQVDDEYFADGMTEEIISRLAAVKEIGVISRTSVMQLKGSKKSLREIGAELGVDYILEGTVRWGKAGQGTSRVRITPQLIRVNDDTHLWADRYDRLIEDIFEVQSDIAEKVTEQLHVTLAEGERRAIEAKPTENMDAYHAFRRGYEYIYNPDSTAENIQFAIQMFEQSVALDSEYAQAHAYLCIGHANMYWYGYDYTPERVARAKAALDRAMALAKNDPETPLAAANFRYHCLLDFEGALEECRRSIQRQPSFAVPLFMSAMIMRRQSRFAEALDTCQRALKLDPLRPLIVGETGSTALQMRRYDEAAGYYDRAIALAPDRTQARAWRSMLELQGRGDVAKARRFLEELRHRGPTEAFVEWCEVLFAERDLAKTLAFIERHGQDVYEDQAWHAPKSWFVAESHRLLGNPEDAKPHYLQAVSYLEPKLAENLQDDRLSIALSIALAGLGRTDEAARLIAGVVERTPASRDAINGPTNLLLQAIVHAGMGDSATALRVLDTILNCPFQVSPAYLRISPYWDKLRDLPEFQELASAPPKVF